MSGHPSRQSLAREDALEMAHSIGTWCAVNDFHSFAEQPHTEFPLSGGHAFVPARWEGGDDVRHFVVSRASTPFVWQHERRLLLLDEEAGLWSLAELEFDEETCRYVEVRRAGYDMEREAIGACLSRALASGFDAVLDISAQLNAWLVENFGHTIGESRARPGSRMF